MLKKQSFASSLLILFAFVFCSCNAPRSILTSGKVLQKNEARIGRNYTFNISSAPIERSVKGSYDYVKNLPNTDTILYSQQVQNLNAAFLAYCLDPIGYNTETFFRYGLGHHLDMGFKSTGGATAFDMNCQFLGSTKSFNESDVGGMYGSIGLQYSWENYRFINIHMFDKIQNLFGLEMSRKDLTVPLVFSKSFGPEERVGCFSFGLVYSHSFVKYKVSTKDIYYVSQNTNLPANLLAPVSGKMNYGAYGAFINLKIGKRYIFFNVSIAAYYQNYGRYPLLGGNTVLLKGISIVPSYGLQFNILPKAKKKAPTGTQI
jgi:hypothetical protein